MHDFVQFFRQCFSDMDLNVNDEDIQFLIQKYDKTKDGEIEFDDFIRIFEGD